MAMITCTKCRGSFDSGMERCPVCRQPTYESLSVQQEFEESDAVDFDDWASNRLGDLVYLSTLPYLPGFDITRSLGLVTATMSHTAWKAASQKARLATAIDGALQTMWGVAKSRGADAVIGISVMPNNSEGGSSAFGSSDGVVVIGTAVRIRPVVDPVP